MKILHYGLGFPPYRSGGLTKYCVDLMLAQIDMGDEVALMWPGRFSLSGHFVHFKSSKKTVFHNGKKQKLNSFEMINPLPVSLDEGIVDIQAYTKECPNVEAFAKLLQEYKPDALHIHTLMGLYKEFVDVAKDMGVKVVFTSHDYFGICPKVTLFRNGVVCDGDCSNCGECNSNALSLNKIKILQSGLYRALKDSAPVKAMRKKHRQEFFEENEEAVGESVIDEDRKNDYEQLRRYYMDLLGEVDIIHFNSSVTEGVYRRFMPDTIKGKVINITHSNIQDKRKEKTFEGKIKLVYLAPAKPFKGYAIMKQALDELWDEGVRDFQLDLYNGAGNLSEYMKLHESFEYSELESIFDKSDILIAPSVWYETFGFTVLEALSFGVPVIVSNNVGAKDLLKDGRYGMVIEPAKDAIKQAIKYVMEHRELLVEYNRRIVEEMNLGRVIRSAEEIEKLYGN